ncbi:MAG: hypothetical protein ACI8ZM_000699 [Crocinitomix sp.]|jgi:hypothetical protein
MKKLLIVVAAAVLFTVVPSCKKGENDPAFSLKTRKARLAGEYDVSSYTYKIKRDKPDDGASTDLTANIEGSTGTSINYITVPPGDIVILSQDISVNEFSFTIRKDGTWESNFDIIITWTEVVDGIIVKNYEYTERSTLYEAGTWNFIGGQAEEFKNKERVMFNTINQTPGSQTTTVTNYQDGSSNTDETTYFTQELLYPDGATTEIYNIDQLKNKEVILTSDEAFNYYETETEVDGSIDVIYNLVATGETRLVLTAR